MIKILPQLDGFREWQNAAIWGCHCINSEQGPSWGQTQHLPPKALPSRIRPPQSIRDQGSASPPPPASPTQQQFPQQHLSTTCSCALRESKPNWPCGTTAQNKPWSGGNQPATSQSPGGLQGCFQRCILVKVSPAILRSWIAQSKYYWTKMLEAKHTLQGFMYVFYSRHVPKMMWSCLQNYWVLTTRAPLEGRNEHPKRSTLPGSSMCQARSLLPKIAYGRHSSFYPKSQEVKC